MNNKTYIVWASDNVKQMSDVGDRESDIEDGSIYGCLGAIGYAKNNISDNPFCFIVGNIDNVKSDPNDINQQVSRVALDIDKISCFDELGVGEVG